jgi:hypothetical protein
MSLRLASLLACFALACSSGKMKVKKGEPQTAREKMLAEEKAKKKKGDGEDEDMKPPGSKQWVRWRYQGERSDCRYLAGRKCFKSQKAACSAMKCKSPAKCESEGAGPATMSCTKSKSKSKS